MAETRDYYGVLGVARDATYEKIKKAYRALARQCHPDVSDAPDAEARFKEINEAYEVLGDPEKRAGYDSTRVWREGMGGTVSQAPVPGRPTGGMGSSGSLFGGLFDLSFGLSATRFRSGGSNATKKEPPEREIKVETIEIPRLFQGLLRAMHRVMKGEGDRLVVVSLYNVRNNRDADSPLWRVTKEGNDVKIEVSTALQEGNYPKSCELSESFGWVNVGSIVCDRLFGGRFEPFILKLRELVEDPERKLVDNEFLSKLNKDGRWVNNWLKLRLKKYEIYKIQSLFLGVTSFEDTRIYKDGERLVIREEDLALLTLLTVACEGRLPKEETVLAITRIEYKRDGRRDEKVIVPQWVVRVKEGRIVEIKVAKGNCRYDEREGSKEYYKQVLKVARSISRGGDFSGAVQELFIKTSRESSEDEPRIVRLTVGDEESPREVIEDFYNYVLLDKREGRVNLCEIEGPGRWSPEEIMRRAVGGKMDSLSMSEVPRLRRKEDDLRYSGPEGGY